MTCTGTLNITSDTNRNDNTNKTDIGTVPLVAGVIGSAYLAKEYLNN